MEKKLPSQEISDAYKKGLQSVSKIDKRRMKKESRKRYRKEQRFKKNKLL